VDRFHTFFYWANIKTWVSLIMLWAARKEIRGLENLPPKGALILVSNHLNIADPPVLTHALPRRIVWMAKRELFQIPVAGFIFRLYGLIPVRRSEADLGALRRAQDALRKGHVVGMFPEGTRARKIGLQKGEPGTAVIALRTGAPILPVAIWGTENVRLPWDVVKRNRIYIAIGEPFDLPHTRRLTRKAVDDATADIMTRIAALLPERYRGVYGNIEAAPVATAGGED
jgi:1-acyl-sn-glycerol-3-phosphate acyltransferase